MTDDRSGISGIRALLVEFSQEHRPEALDRAIDGVDRIVQASGFRGLEDVPAPTSGRSELPL